MISEITTGLFALIGFTFIDRILTAAGVASPYYAVHAAHNAYIVYSTAGDLYTTFADFHHLDDYPANTKAALVVAALHLYHFLVYRHKFQLDDWLHHGLMIGVAIPIGLWVSRSPLLGFSLFFSTGLPGGIDYLLLFLQRNGFIDRLTEKAVNRWLNVWIRSPGCVGHAVLTAAYVCSSEAESWLALVPASLMYWNGQYFLERVVADHAVQLVRA
jgi:hypothetical protein